MYPLLYGFDLIITHNTRESLCRHQYHETIVDIKKYRSTYPLDLINKKEQKIYLDVMIRWVNYAAALILENKRFLKE